MERKDVVNETKLVRTFWYRELFEVPADLLDLSRHPGFLMPSTWIQYYFYSETDKRSPVDTTTIEKQRNLVLNMIDLAKTATQTQLISFEGGAIWPNAKDLSTTANQPHYLVVRKKRMFWTSVFQSLRAPSRRA